MLQDLDARGGGAGRQPGADASMRPVAAPVADKRRVLIAGGAGMAVLMLAAAGWLGWQKLQRPPAGAAPASEAAAAMPPQAAPVFAGQLTHPVPPAAGVAPAQPAPAVPAQAPQVPAAPTASSPGDAPHADPAATPKAELEAELKAARKKAREARAEAAALATAHRQPAARTVVGGTATPDNARIAALADLKRAPPPKDDKAPKAPQARAAEAPPRLATNSGVTVTSEQQGDNAYRRGLAALQEARINDAIANLEQAVFVYPRHDAARQTLVGLLLESHRADDAMRHLQFGLSLDPKQAQMAMLLARLQIERGGPAIDTLQRTLPYASGQADYLGFLAGALQRVQRHKEAIDQYQAALRLTPQNGVWWMGLGISLQAEKRTAEAADAYARAKASGRLSAELTAFVDRKLQLLGR